ncbi:MAG: DUF5681 domain-containing protein [Sulfitobacter sp.]
MANPNPSPATRFKEGQSGNPKGKTPSQRANEMAAAEIAAEMRHKALIRMQERALAGEDVLDMIDANALKLFKDSEDRAHGTPTATIAGDPERPLAFGAVGLAPLTVDDAND